MLLGLFGVFLIFIVAFSKSWKAVALRVGALCLLALIISFLWIAFPFSAERWKGASLLEKRLLARNFLNRYEPQGMTQADIVKLFDVGKFHDEWQYYVKTNQSVTGLSGIYVRFAEGKVASVEPWFSKQIDGTSPYSSSEWRVADQSKRASMISDLVRREVLIGKTKQEILSELGDPNRWSVLAYYLGMFPWLAEMDAYGLEFELDQSLKVRAAGIVQY